MTRKREGGAGGAGQVSDGLTITLSTGALDWPRSRSLKSNTCSPYFHLHAVAYLKSSLLTCTTSHSHQLLYQSLWLMDGCLVVWLAVLVPSSFSSFFVSFLLVVYLFFFVGILVIVVVDGGAVLVLFLPPLSLCSYVYCQPVWESTFYKFTTNNTRCVFNVFMPSHTEVFEVTLPTGLVV